MSGMVKHLMIEYPTQIVNRKKTSPQYQFLAVAWLRMASKQTLCLMAMLGLLVLGTLQGCGAQDEAKSLEIFRQRWFEAVNKQDGESLYTMLDAASKRWVSRELDELRGLDEKAQKRVIDQLGGQRAENLLGVTPGQYFGLLWRLATEGRRPTMKVEAAGEQTAYITLSLNDAAPQRIRLAIEGGHWVWQLPEADFSVRAKKDQTVQDELGTGTP